MFGRNRRAEAEALNEMRAEMIAAAGDRAKLAQVLQKLEVTLTADFDRQARERATTELGVENLRQSVNGHTTALAEAVQQVASMCALLAERIESERLERHALIEALAALRTAPTPELGRGTDEPRVVGGNVFTSRDQAVEADVVIIDEPGDGTQPPLALGNLVRCRFGDQWIDDLEVCEVIDVVHIMAANGE